MQLFYEVDELYIGILGIVESKKELKIRKTNPLKCIIYKKEKIANQKDYCAVDILTKEQYYFFYGNKKPKKTINKAINSYAIDEIISLNTIIDSKIINHYQLIKLSENLINIIKDKLNLEEKSPQKEQITDSVMNLLLETSDKVSTSSCSKKQKKYLLKELEDLGKYYTNSLKKIKNPGLTLNNELSLKMEIIRKIVDIEELCQSPESIQDLNLEEDSEKLKKELKRKIKSLKK